MSWRSCSGHGYGSAEDVLSERAALAVSAVVLEAEKSCCCSRLRHVSHSYEWSRGSDQLNCLQISRIRRAYFLELEEQEDSHQGEFAACSTTLAVVAQAPRY